MNRQKTSPLFIKNLAALNKWLHTHHYQKESVWLVYYKPTTNKSDVTYTSLVDVLLAYGWIDSLPRKVDHERTSLRISPRNPKSNWSRVNKEKVSRLLKAGHMQPSGIATVQLAKQRGTWDALNDVEKLVLPKEFAQKLKKMKKTKQWDALSRSLKRGFLEQLFNAKKLETKDKLIEKMITSL